MRAACFVALMGVLVGGAGVAAQPYGTKVFFSAFTTPRSILSIDNNGKIQTVISSLRTYGNMVCIANNDKDIVVGFPSSPPELLRLDPSAGAFIGTIWSGAPIGYVDYFNATGDGNYVVGSNTTLFLVKGDGSSVSTIRAGSPFRNIQGLCQDIATGGYAVGDITTDSVYIVLPDGTVSTTWNLTGMNPFSLTQDHRDGFVIVGNGGLGRVHRIDRNIGTIKTITTSAGNANAICFDRWSGNGEIVVGSNPIYRMDVTGTVVTSHPGVSFANTGMCFENGRNVVCIRTGSPNRYRFDLHVPGQKGKGYVLGLSITGFTPGIPIDSRAVQLVLDPVLILSVTGKLFPLLQGNIGTLNGLSGRGQATLDLSAFGKLLTGLRVWAAAVTIDTAAPSNVGVISKPLVFVLE